MVVVNLLSVSSRLEVYLDSDINTRKGGWEVEVTASLDATVFPTHLMAISLGRGKDVNRQEDDDLGIGSG